MIIPRNEIELVILFAQHCATDDGLDIVSFDGSFPDGVVSWDGKDYRVEFEYQASNFISHKHDPVKCDLIVCWIDDDDKSVLPIVALNNPDWRLTKIELLSASEKTARYWKERALKAEEILKASMLSIDNGEDNITPSQKSEVIMLVHQGMSYRAITQEVWGQRGTFYNKKIDAILLESGILPKET